MGAIKKPENIFIAKIKILKRSSINDPEGNTIAEALNNLGFDDIDSVRIGKYIEITLESKNKKTKLNIVIKSRIVKDEGIVRLTVVDNGIGFPVNILDQVFEPYITTKSK